MKLPPSITLKEIFVVSICASIGLTVALFVSGQAFTDSQLQSDAKVGSLMSLMLGFIAVCVGKCFGVGIFHPQGKQHDVLFTKQEVHRRSREKCVTVWSILIQQTRW